MNSHAFNILLMRVMALVTIVMGGRNVVDGPILNLDYRTLKISIVFSVI